MKQVAIIAALALLLGGAALPGAQANRQGHTMAQPPTVTRHPKGNFTLAQAQAFANFPLYFAGPNVAGFPLEAAVRIEAAPFAGEQVRQDDVTFLYGSCEAVGDDACASPLQIQVWNGCQRYPAMYAIPSDESLTIRGVPASFYEEWTRLELYTGAVTVVLFGNGRDQLLEVAAALRGINHRLGPTQNLPAPARGLMEGKMRCQS